MSGVLDDLAAGRVALHSELIRWGLVTWTSGNVSGRYRARTCSSSSRADPTTT